MRQRIFIRGIVQGVGFRPFVYNLARKLGVNGFVLNTSDGVMIEAEAPELNPFVHGLRTDAPALSRIDEMTVLAIEPRNESGFTIRHSSPRLGEFALVPADVGTCGECLGDSTQEGNRRFGYAFTNCTNCGPRYTIMRDVPYDRPSTTMASFRMCPECAAEYSDPANRRFHAQPNACPACGPRLSVPLRQIVEWLRAGKIIALKGLGGFHLACDASNAQVVARLRERKRKSDKPFAIMVRDLAVAERHCYVGAGERDLLQSALRPIVLLRRRESSALPRVIAPGNDHLGLMLPYTPLHSLLFHGSGFEALVMTSGNVSEEPIVSREDELDRLEGIADERVTHNRPIQMRVDDSVLRCYRGHARVIRRSRGYAPMPITLGRNVQQVLAAGAELKNTFCLTKQRYAILSQHIGDLENFETLMFFRETLEHMRRFFRVDPVAVAHDLHPGYLSTSFAQESGLPMIGVQHHHAHIASCMAENHLEDTVIGVALDGTGYGSDGQVWGGEVLVADYKRFERKFHFRYVPMAGGDAAVREPWRMALSYLMDAYGSEIPDLLDVDSGRLLAMQRILTRRSHTVETSSCGRLFDAAAALLGIRNEANYEAQAAIELESAAAGTAIGYRFDLGREEIDFRQTIRDLVRDDSPLARRATRFHQTVANAIVAACERTTGYRRVCLSGGCFQNMRLLDATVRGLELAGFEVYLHSEVPTNDGGLSLGQAMIANAALK